MTRPLEEIIKAEEEFTRYHKKLRDEINLSHWHFRVLEYIKEIQQDYNEELNQAPAFWGLTVNAHVFSLLTRLNNFFGKNATDSHLHMFSFLSFIKNNLDIFTYDNFERRLCEVNR